MMNPRNYTNTILTVIATLLLVLVLQRGPLSLDPTPAAQAERGVSDRYAPQQITTDPATAAATQEVAEANKEIAKQVGEVAKAIRDVAKSMDRATAGRGN